MHGTRLIKFIKDLKKTFPGLKIKLDTNGSFPLVIKKIIQTNLVDFIAMDIKTTKEKYIELTNCSPSDVEHI